MEMETAGRRCELLDSLPTGHRLPGPGEKFENELPSTKVNQKLPLQEPVVTTFCSEHLKAVATQSVFD